jgi:hypothetical protein
MRAWELHQPWNSINERTLRVYKCQRLNRSFAKGRLCVHIQWREPSSMGDGARGDEYRDTKAGPNATDERLQGKDDRRHGRKHGG